MAMDTTSVILSLKSTTDMSVIKRSPDAASKLSAVPERETKIEKNNFNYQALGFKIKIRP